jgi:UDP-GlcNAc:undecaprenyl-phosphate GlcNAc-1-phosphate transferase
MGDAGSMLLGFSVVWIMIGIGQGPDRFISPVQGLWFAALPIFDFFTCFVRRILDGKSPFTPGRDHVHHILQRGGFTVRQRLTILVGIQAAYSIIGVGTHFLGVPDGTTFTAWALLGISQRAAFRLLVRRYRARRLATRQAQACRTP